VLLKLAVVQPVLRQDHRGDIAALQRIADDLRLLVGIGDIGHDQHQAAAVLRFGHELFPFPADFAVCRPIRTRFV
jgi:hypothetical protein